MWTYSQRSGNIFRDGRLEAKGYSGHGIGKNVPEADRIPNVGPIPRGAWEIVSLVEHTERHGPYVMILRPKPGTDTHGRSAFMWHGDNVSDPGNGSEGCIVSDRPSRTAVWTSGDRDLQVVAEDPMDGWVDAGAGMPAGRIA